MTADILLALGGVGLFLLGMMIMTDGLKSLAGNALRRTLAKFTTNTVSGAAAGAVTTAIIQSSSATTVTAIGFVGAGLMTFTQALGIIFGANIGTTLTGWLVALIGFKLNLGLAALPMVLAGALLHMFGKGRLKSLGWALAGFSLLFIGIDAMQSGMAAFEGQVTPDTFPSDTLLGRLQLVFLGVVITLITQSSSAGVATAMVALGSGAISFPQAAAMVIGMDVGTTFTAYLATIGGSTAMRQTGYAHVIYNVMTGIMAFILVGFYTDFVAPLVSAGTAGDAQVALVAFHTSFNTLGVILVLPFAGQFARFINSLVPDTSLNITARLDDALVTDSAAATDAVVGTIQTIAVTLFKILSDLLDPDLRDDAEQRRLHELARALDDTRAYFYRVQSNSVDESVQDRHVSILHALDHLERLLFRCRHSAPLAVRRSDARLRRLAGILEQTTQGLLSGPLTSDVEKWLDRVRSLMRRQRRSYRQRLIVLASKRHVSPEQTDDRLDSILWLQRSAYHLWRIVHHVRLATDPLVAPQESPDKPEENEQNSNLWPATRVQ